MDITKQELLDSVNNPKVRYCNGFIINKGKTRLRTNFTQYHFRLLNLCDYPLYEVLKLDGDQAYKEFKRVLETL